MKRVLFIILVILSFLIQGITGCTKESSVIINTDSGKHTFNVEIANNTIDRAKGLMYRESLSKNKGMLFVYSGERERSFWMKNTLIPLDMIFISAQKEIVDINKNAQPCGEGECVSYTSKEPAQYVLEVNAGIAEEIGFSIGDSVIIRR